MTREQILQMQASARIYQKLYDDAYASWGMRAPAPTYNDSIDAVSDYAGRKRCGQRNCCP